MTKEEAIDAIYNGKLVECTIEEYPEIRNALQIRAGILIDQGDILRSILMLEEVSRLDRMHGW